MIGRVLIAALLTVAMIAPVFADPHSRKIERREHRQKQRIKEGVQSGELTRPEAKKLGAEQAGIRAKEREMKSDGVFTREERQELHQDLNESSHHLFEQKHDAQDR
jgi:hypothetical protein